MLDYLERAARHFQISAVVFCLTLAVLTGLVLLRDKLYEARTLILFTLGREYVYVPESRQSDIKAPNPGDFQGVVNAEMLLLGNPQISRSALEAVGLGRAFPELPSTEEGLLEGLVRLHAATAIELITGSYVVKVSVRHTNPVIAADLANALSSAFLGWRRSIYADIESASLRTRLDAASSQASEIASKAAELLDGADPMVIEGELQNAMGEQLHLASLLRDANATRAALIERRTALEGQLGVDGDRVSTEIAVQEQDARIRYLQAALQELDRKVRHLSSLMPHLRLVKASQQTQAERIADLELRLRDSEALAAFPQQDNVRVIERAVPPLQPVSMPVKLQLVVSGLVAGLLGFGVLFAAVVLDRRVVSAQGASADLRARALGELPVSWSRRARMPGEA